MSVSGLGFRRISDSEYRRRGLEMPDGLFGREGPAISDEFQRRISIDFGVDPFEVARQDRMNFTAIRPIGPSASTDWHQASCRIYVYLFHRNSAEAFPA
jgi:hypothetical protein